jgi:hypothetical protein
MLGQSVPSGNTVLGRPDTFGAASLIRRTRTLTGRGERMRASGLVERDVLRLD